MITIEATISGTSPLLCNRFTDAAALAASRSTRASATAGASTTPKEEAEARLYLSESEEHKGEPIIPAPNLFRCLIDAGKFFKIGRSKVTTLQSSMVPAALAIAEIELLIDTRDGWAVDTRAVRVPATGGRILCHRPCFHDWRLSFTIEADPEMMDAKFVRELVDAAGKKIGLGDFRPDRKGPFGRFVVDEWKVDEPASTDEETTTKDAA